MGMGGLDISCLVLEGAGLSSVTGISPTTCHSQSVHVQVSCEQLGSKWPAKKMSA
jgi:hypothetical protein